MKTDNIRKSVGFSAVVTTEPMTTQSPEVNKLLLQAIVVACQNDDEFRDEVIRSVTAMGNSERN